MKIFGLTLGQFGAALLLAGCIAFIYTSATMPHPVEVPKIAITPVPTPPPVVITEKPTSTPESCDCANKIDPEIATGAFNAVSAIPMVIIAVGIIMLIFGAASGPNLMEPSAQMTTSMSTTASAISSGFGVPLGIIVALGGVMITLYIIASIMGSLNNVVIASSCICP